MPEYAEQAERTTTYEVRDSDSPPSGAVDRRIDVLSAVVDVLEQRVDRLRDRLFPALLPSSPMAGGMIETAEAPNQCPTADRLMHIHARVDLLVGALGDITERIDL